MQRNKYYLICWVLTASFVLLFGLYIYTDVFKNNLQEENQLLREVFSLNIEYEEVYKMAAESNNYYTLASSSYDYSQYPLVITNCEISREKGWEYVQEVNQIKLRLKDKEQEVFKLFAKMMKEQANMFTALFESCEAFEAASRAYSVDDYVMGGKNIDLHNEQIRKHDRAVERYNELYIEYLFELRRELKLN